MDCNSYSYTPHMLDEQSTIISSIRNDDMTAELDHPGNYFSVWAYSYDGQMDIYETFTSEEPARKLYNHIIANYTDTPPIKRELNRVIKALHKEDLSA